MSRSWTRTITARNTARAISALRLTVHPQVEPTTEFDTWDCCVPVTLARSARTLAIWAEVSEAVSTWTCVGLPGWLAICTTFATGPSASETCAWVTGWAGWTLNTPPPLKSKLISPWYRRLAMDTGVDSSSFEILDGGADAHEPPFLEQPRPGEQAHRRPAVGPDRG